MQLRHIFFSGIETCSQQPQIPVHVSCCAWRSPSFQACLSINASKENPSLRSLFHPQGYHVYRHHIYSYCSYSFEIDSERMVSNYYLYPRVKRPRGVTTTHSCHVPCVSVQRLSYASKSLHKEFRDLELDETRSKSGVCRTF